MLPLITSQMQDDVLRWLCENVRPNQPTDIDLPSILTATSIDVDTLEAILEDFEEKGLISDFSPMRAYTTLTLKVKSHKFLQTGGFTVIDALNEANIQKLLYELEHLKKQLTPDQFETYNKIASMASSIATVVAAFNSK